MNNECRCHHGAEWHHLVHCDKTEQMYVVCLLCHEGGTVHEEARP